MTDRSPFRPRKPLVMGSFLLVALAATALFVPTFAGHTAVMNKVSIDATATDYHLSEDGDELVVRIRVRNPTGSAFTARFGDLYGKVGGEQVTGLGVDVEETTIPAGETRTVTARIDVREDHREQLREAVESGELTVTGQLRGTIQDVYVQVDVLEGDDG